MPPLRGASSFCVDTTLTRRPVVPQRLRPRPSSLKGLRRGGLIYWGGAEFWCAYGTRSVAVAKLASRWSVEQARSARFGARQHTPNIALRRCTSGGRTAELDTMFRDVNQKKTAPRSISRVLRRV